jgi:hypothetical protein
MKEEGQKKNTKKERNNQTKDQTNKGKRNITTNTIPSII